MIEFKCPGCGKVFSVPDDFAGRCGTCRECGHSLRAPWLSEIVLTPSDEADDSLPCDTPANPIDPINVSSVSILSHDTGYGSWLAVVGTLVVMIMGAVFGMLIGAAFDLTYWAGAGGALAAAGFFWLFRVSGIRFSRRNR